MVGGHLGPGQAPAAGPRPGCAPCPASRLRLDRLRPIPSGRTSPEPVRAGRGGAAGFVAGPGFDRDERRAADREPAGWTAGRPASRPSASEPPPIPGPGTRRPRGGGPAAGPLCGRRRRTRPRTRTRSRRSRPEHPAAPGRRAARPGRRSGRRRGRRKILIGAGLAVVLAGAAVAVEAGVFGGGGPAHTLVTPDKLGAYVRRPQLEKQMNAAQLQREVITKSAGQASHVVSAVYEDGTSATSSKPPQMILFIGGNLTGVSASGFIASFTQQSKGAFVTSAGSLGGSAACVNAQASVPAASRCAPGPTTTRSGWWPRPR